MSVQTGQDEHLAKPAEGFTTLRELTLSEAVPVRVRNVFESLCPDTEFLRLSPKDALARWAEVEDRLLLCHAFGVGSANALHAVLRKAVAALGDEQNGQTLLNGNDSSKVQSLRDLATSNLAPIRIRGVFRKLRKDTLICKLSIDDAWANWGLVEEYLLQQRNFGQTSADELRQMVERACIETRQNCNTDSCQVADGTRAMDAPAESPLSGEPSRWLLGLMVSRDSAEWQSYADVVDGLTLADIAEEAPLFLTGAKPNWRGLVAEFLDRSARWIHTSETGLVSLTPVGHAHLRRWSLNANEKLTAEWLAVLFLIEKLAAYRSLLPMVVADTTYDDKKLLLRVSREGFLFRESKRRLVANSGVIAKLLTHFKTDPVNPPAPRLSSDLLIDLLLFDRNDRHKEVITARLCPASGCIRTLEETGQLFRVTRERIRQIVSNWEVAIAEDGRRDLAAQFVQDQEQTWIDDLEKAFASADIDRKATNDEIGSLLPPDCRLLLCASGLDPGKWVSQHTERANGTVYFVHASDTRIEEADVFLREVMEEQVDLPQLASHFFNLPDHFEETVHFTEAVRQGKLVAFSTPTGIVLSDNNSAHSRRLAFVISVFEEHPDWILSDQQLWNAICELSDTRAARGQWRVFSTSIRSAPCRYRRLPRIGWLDLIDCHT